MLRPAVMALALILAAGGAASAQAEAPTGCASPPGDAEVLFDDNFDELEPAWGETDTAFFGEDGRLVIMPAADSYYAAISNAGLYDDIDFCVTVTTVKTVPGATSNAGAIFWAADYDNYYAALVQSDGTVGIFRKQRGRTLAQSNYETFPAVKTGDGAENTVRILTVGKQVSVYVNNELFKQVRGTPPTDGQLIGVRATSPKEDRAEYAFDNLRILRPAPAQGQ
jgi:hypothetical protein